MVEKILTIAKAAGAAIMEVYDKAPADVEITRKGDNSPLTEADRAAHAIIARELEAHFSFPILSEEGAATPYETRKNWETYWLVDPLDGTKEFIKRNGQFTVNIALMQNNRPVLGVIFAPALQRSWCAAEGKAFVEEADGTRSALQVNHKKVGEPMVAIMSRSHGSQSDQDSFLEKYNLADTLSVGSSLKFCMVAEGKADIYYRPKPTSEWDTAAGQAVLEAAGGVMTTPEGESFPYNKENVLNGPFFCTGFAR